MPSCNFCVLRGLRSQAAKEGCTIEVVQATFAGFDGVDVMEDGKWVAWLGGAETCDCTRHEGPRLKEVKNESTTQLP